MFLEEERSGGNGWSWMVLIHDKEFGIWRFDSHIHSFCTIVYNTVAYYTSIRYNTSTGEYSIVDDCVGKRRWYHTYGKNGCNCGKYATMSYMEAIKPLKPRQKEKRLNGNFALLMITEITTNQGCRNYYAEISRISCNGLLGSHRIGRRWTHRFLRKVWSELKIRPLLEYDR